MAKAIIRRSQEYTMTFENGETAVFEIRGLNSLDALEAGIAVNEKRIGDLYRITLDKGVVRVISGITDEKGNVATKATADDLAECLSVERVLELVKAVDGITNPGQAAKKG